MVRNFPIYLDLFPLYTRLAVSYGQNQSPAQDIFVWKSKVKGSQNGENQSTAKVDDGGDENVLVRFDAQATAENGDFYFHY